MPLPLIVDGIAFLEPVARIEFAFNGFGNLGQVSEAVGLHTAGDIDGIAPEIVDEFLTADNAGDDGPDVDAHTQADGFAMKAFVIFNRLQHKEREFGDRFGMIGARLRDAGSDHVGVADGLDLLQPMSGSQIVE